MSSEHRAFRNASVKRIEELSMVYLKVKCQHYRRWIHSMNFVIGI